VSISARLRARSGSTGQEATKKMNNCQLCDGRGEVECPHCHGWKQEDDGKGGYRACHMCDGRGKCTCPRCGGSGRA
jgi:hypothetical protein